MKTLEPRDLAARDHAIALRKHVQKNLGLGIDEAVALCAQTAGYSKRTWWAWEAGAHPARHEAIQFAELLLRDGEV